MIPEARANIARALLDNADKRKSGQKTVRTFLIYSQMTVELFTSFMVSFEYKLRNKSGKTESSMCNTIS